MTDNEEYINKLKKYKAEMKLHPKRATVSISNYIETLRGMIASLEGFNNEIEQLKNENKELQNKILELETKAKIVPRIVYRKR